jgi:ferric-dicitrate binding protein FerR (iron transport regulator)
MPEIPEERVKLLVYKYLANSLTEEESYDLNAFGAEHPQVWLLIARLQDEDQLTSDLEEIHEMDVKGALEDAWVMINGEHRPFYKKPFWRTAAAILLVLAVAGGALTLWLRRHQDITGNPDGQKDTKHAFIADIHGSNDKATLTLGGGQQIVLEDQPKGDIAFQNGARLIKTDSGLTYIAVPLPYVEDRSNSIPVQYNTLTTSRASQVSILLPDGTRVWLNDSSQLSYPTFFAGPYREVALTGEAYFEVAKSPGHPFHVKVNDLTINVLGTCFTVRAYGDEGSTTTSLLQGKLTVQSGRKEQLLAPNEQVIVDRHKKWFFRQEVDPDSVTAWKEGIFYFRHADIPTVMHALSRWYGIEVEMRVPASQYYWDGELSREVSLSTILNYLTNEDVHFVRQGNKVIVTP